MKNNNEIPKSRQSCSASFDGLVRDPVNRVAAAMLSKGVKAPTVNFGSMTHWETCPALYPKEEISIVCRGSGVDLTGRRQGRMVVVGLSRDIAARWVMRCDCGDYEPRTAKSIKNPNNSNDCCTVCRKIEEAKRRHHYHTTGKDL